MQTIQLLPLIEAIYTAFCDTYAGDFFFAGESHPMWELDYVIWGSCSVTSGTDVYSLQQGELIIHRPNIFHTAEAEGAKVSMLTISFTGRGIENILSGGKYIPGESEKQLLSLLLPAVQKLHGNPDKVRALLESLLLFLAENTRQERIDTRFTAIAEYMQNNVMKSLTIGDIEAEFGLSATVLRNIFHQYTGVSPIEYFHTLRITAALSLLQQHTVSETARLMDFSSPAYFSYFFKKRTGQSPAKSSRRQPQSRIQSL